MAQEVDISIIIVNYNVKDFLLQCLRSIENSKKNLDIQTIVVDNNSTDGSLSLLKPLFPDVEFIASETNLGFGKANNLGIEIASGKYTLILNPDTLLQEDTLSIMYEYMEHNVEAGIAGCRVLNADGTFQMACRRGFPTPWVAFTKLFGLQKLFPKSKLFGRYNLTYLNDSETYFIDSVIGAFMFCRTDLLKQVGAFDTDYFMYGEDIDLCKRIKNIGYKTAYVHTTSIIHYKGESTKRSNINDVRHFYEAMQIYVGKHHSRSHLFVLLLRFGIFIRSIFAHISKYKKDILIILADLLIANFALILGTKLKFGRYFGFPDYAYPLVFIVLSLVIITSMIGVGEYFESKNSIRKSFLGFMITFFFLSSLTYFFRSYAFSRGVLLMTIGCSVAGGAFIRFIILLINKTRGAGSDRNIALVGLNDNTENIVSSLQNADVRNAVLVGVISTNITQNDNFAGLPVIGNIEFLSHLIEQYNLQEIIITDNQIAKQRLISIIASQSGTDVRIHVAQDYDEILIARVIDEITGIEKGIIKYSYNKFRYRFFKRIFDIVLSMICLTAGLPLIAILSGKNTIKNVIFVLRGKYSYIGLYKTANGSELIGKQGIIGLAHISKPERLSEQAIKSLNEYYLQNYSLSLEFDIVLKYIIRKYSGKINT